MDRLHRIGLMLAVMSCISCGEIPCENGHCPAHAKTGAPPLAGAVNIVGGDLVVADEWQAAHTVVLLGGDGQPFCTATRIGPNHVVTAAHCLDNPIPAMGIAYGVLDDYRSLRESADVGGGGFTRETRHRASTVKILATVVHPSFVSDPLSKDASDFHDIGLVLFEGAFDASVTPIADFADFPVRTHKLSPTHQLVKSGYGAISDHDKGKAALRSVDLQVMRLDEKNFELEYQRKTGKGTCYGDSGGPGFVMNGTAPRLIGVTSRGPDTGGRGHRFKKEAPCDEGNGIDTDARYYRAWLECAARALHERFAAEGSAIDPLEVRVEHGDESAVDCGKNRIESLDEAFQRVKSQCESEKGHTYDGIAGSCLITSKKACEKAGGQWDKKDKTCSI